MITYKQGTSGVDIEINGPLFRETQIIFERHGVTSKDVKEALEKAQDKVLREMYPDLEADCCDCAQCQERNGKSAR